MVTKKTKKALSGLALVLGSQLPALAYAEPDTRADADARAEAERPVIHHAPQLTALQSKDVTIEASFDRPHKLRRALLVFRSGRTHGEVEFARSSSAAMGYVAVIPAAAVRGELAYAIELETTGGEHIPAFATRASPHPVTVLDSPADRREAALLAKLGGRRSVVEASSEYASFGSVTTTARVPGNAPQRLETPDQYYRVEGSYTYRLLGIVSEFGLRAGMVRGESLVPGESDPSKYKVGLNYGAPRVRLRAVDWLHFEGELLTSVTEVGFSVGGGGAILIGDPYGSKLVLGVEGIQVFGARGYTRLDVAASKRLLLSPIIEVTSMPHADSAGVRLLGEGRVDLGRGFGLVVRGGYQARTFDRGGPTLGGGLAYAF